MKTFFHALRSRGRLGCAWLVMACAVVSGCAKDIPVFAPPSARTVAAVDKPWADGLLTLAYHDVEDRDPDQSYLSVRTDHLVEQLTWLRLNGYQAVSVDQVLAARNGGAPLPKRAVLLSFDDGYRSFYTRVFPILKAYQWPFVFAPVGTWLDTPANQQVDFGGKMTARDRFLTWDEVREMARSPLVEVGAHTDNLHYGLRANPQGNEQPAAATHRYDAASGAYESGPAFESRLRADVKAITDKVRQASGRSPRVWVWPYGAASGPALKIVQEHGYALALTLEDGLGTVDRLMAAPRLLLSADPQTRNFAASVTGTEAPKTMRVAHVDLDHVYDADPAQMDRNLGQLVQRIADLGITTVFLQAFADPDGDGLVRELYFPNRWLPMRADLFNRAAWQLRTRTDVEIYAWMPVLSFELAPELPRVTRADAAGGERQVDPKAYRRLSPFDPRVRQRIGDLYEDLARHSAFQGILFHDDAVLSDFEDAGPQALAAYQAAGLPGSIAALRADPQTMQQWTRFKSRALIDFTHELTQRVRAVRGPQVATARNLFALPILQPESEAWFAQNLDDFLSAYDWTAPMAMPWMEGVAPARADAWLDAIVDAVARRPGALERTVFELQAKDWRQPGAPAVPSETLAGWMQRLQLRGARNFGHYPDDFVRNEPRLDVIRPALSSAWYPHHD